MTENWQHRMAHYNLTIEFPEWQSMTAQNHALQCEERIHRMTENNLRVEFTARQRKRSHIDDAGKTLLRDNGATCKLGLRTRLHHGRKQPKLQCRSSPWRPNLCNVGGKGESGHLSEGFKRRFEELRKRIRRSRR